MLPYGTDPDLRFWKGFRWWNHVCMFNMRTLCKFNKLLADVQHFAAYYRSMEMPLLGYKSQKYAIV
jgi:hypothetical protein